MRLGAFCPNLRPKPPEMYAPCMCALVFDFMFLFWLIVTSNTDLCIVDLYVGAMCAAPVTYVNFYAS